MSKILQENILHGEFTFGFELEAYVDGAEIPTDPNSSMWEEVLDLSYNNPSEYPTMHDVMLYLDYNEELLSELYSFDDVEKVAEKKMNKLFPQNEPWIIKPSTGVTYDGSLGICGFEWPSPTMKFTPEAIHSCITFLKNLKNENIYVDYKCGFHVHLAYPTITEKDAMWIVCNLAMDEEIQKEIIELDQENCYFEFVGDYAKTDYLDDIKYAIEHNNFKELSQLLDNTKYRLLRIHPQGTLEWRGPRDFIEYDDAIKPFFVKLYKFVSWISYVMNKKSLGEYTKENFLSMIESRLSFGGVSKSMMSLLERLVYEPKLIKVFDKINVKQIVKMGWLQCKVRDMWFGGSNIISRVVNECVVKQNMVIPPSVLAYYLTQMNITINQKCDVVRHLHQPIPVKIMEKTYPLLGQTPSTYAYGLFYVLKAYSIDDILQIINDVDNKYKEHILNYLCGFWKKVYDDDPIPPKICNALILKFGVTKEEIQQYLDKKHLDI